MKPRKPLVLLLLIAATALLAACGDDDSSGDDSGAAAPAEPAAAAPAFEETTPAEIAPDVESGDVLLVDVREDEEWDAGHAPDAIHIPLATVGDELDQIEEEADGRPVAFICRSGNRSAEASRIAVDGGLTDVINVLGGMGAWVDAGLPIVPEDGEII